MTSVRARVGVVLGALLALVVVAAAAPVAADAVYVQIRNAETGWCLDSNARGSVYINPCELGNRFQMWERWDGGWTRNVATRRCLTTYTLDATDTAGTLPCLRPVRTRQVWRSWQRGWYQRPAMTYSRARCLKRRLRSVHGVDVTVCRNPFGAHHPRELWYVMAVEPTPMG